MNKDFVFIMNQLKKWEKGGLKTLSNGTVLVCNVPHVASQAWLHEIYAPLKDEDIEELETEMGKKLPVDYIEFLRCANGINIFSDSLSLWGKRSSYSRKGDDAIQPYDIVALSEELVDEIPEDWLTIGSYSWDGSVIIYDTNKDKRRVCRCTSDDYEILQEWPNLWNWLKNEVVRLSKLFDENGVEYDENTPTTP